MLDLNGDPMRTFPAGHKGWLEAIRFAEQQGGELDVVFMAFVSAA